MKKRVLFTSSLVLASTFIAGGSVFAAEPTQTANVDATITFVDNSKPVEPVDPENPSQPIDPSNPGDGTNTGQTGDLTINYASNFRFGNHTLAEAAGQTYFANLDNGKANRVQVTDKRVNTELNGWKLTAERSEFTSGENTLTGAKLTVSNLAVASADGGIAPETVAANGTEIGVGSANAAVIAKAEASQGAGTWVVRYGSLAGNADADKSVSLEVPTAPTVEGTYKAVVTYKLYNTPA